MNPWTLFAFALLYFAGLFAIALYGDSHSGRRRTRPLAALIFSLTLAVYCTSWTFFGAVGSAAQGGWSFLPIYLGPFLVFIFGYPLLKKTVRIGKRQNTTSIADFLSSRYSKRRGIALLVTFICTLAGIPYIALQLKAVSHSVHLLTADTQLLGVLPQANTSLMVAGAMMLFAILFGTRQVDVSKHHYGMMLTIATESLVKLSALLVLALYVIFVFYSGPSEFWTELMATQAFHWNGLSMNFLTQLLLAGSAIVLLPRQFHVMVVENLSPSHLRTARWLFPLYLILISLVILPITTAGLRLFAGTGVDADTFVLRLPQAGQQTWLTLLVFIGGFSASMAMIVITTLSLSTMLSNDAVLPFVLRRRAPMDAASVEPSLIMVRRLIIVLVILSAWAFLQGLGEPEALSAIGLLAFSLIVQLLPAFIGGLYWHKGHALGAYAGMSLGTLLWTWTLLVPRLAEAGLVPATLLSDGPWGIGWLAPEQLFGIRFEDSLSHGVFFSLLINSLAYIYVSKRARANLSDRLQASAFVQLDRHQHDPVIRKSTQVTVGELVSLLERFAGPSQAKRWLEDYRRTQDQHLATNDPPSGDFCRYIERTLSGVIGASSARAMMHSALAGRELLLEDVVTFFDETTQAIQFNQKILSSTLENLDHGVSVVDRDLRLVAWNRQYQQLYPYPKTLLRVGTPIESLVRFNAERGECGPGDVEQHVQKRLEHLRSGSAHRFIRIRPNGQVIEIRGNPLPGGGFVTTFNDISDFVKAQEALQEAKLGLEQRVIERTEEVRQANAELRAEVAERRKAEALLRDAKTEAEAANASKTRFLALASHDILQPLNAARLYTAALLEEQPSHPTLPKLESALHNSEALIATLLEIAKLDANPEVPVVEPLSLNNLLQSLQDEFSPVAEQRGLNLKVRTTRLGTESDPRLLRRIIQNLISNALKYTESGGVLVGARRYRGQVVIDVFDTGLGIAVEDQEKIFQDFQRLPAHQSMADGVGLGLSVVARLSAHLNHPISVTSVAGRGSRFRVTVPECQLAEPVQLSPTTPSSSQPWQHRVLLVDDDAHNIEALRTLLERWGAAVQGAQTRAEAMRCASPDVVIIDYHLADNLNGLSLYAELCQHWGNRPPAILVSAHLEGSVPQQAAEQGLAFLAKPVKPAALRALLKSFPIGQAKNLEAANKSRASNCHG